MARFGDKVQFLTIAFKGELPEEDCRWLADKILKELRLSKVAKATVHKYPIDNKGGVGYTFFQPFTESFLIVDVWEKLEKSYLFLCSCKPFWSSDVTDILSSRGYHIIETKTQMLGELKNGTNV